MKAFARLAMKGAGRLRTFVGLIIWSALICGNADIAPAAATLQNGRFESGDFSSWTVLYPDPVWGYAAVVPAASGYGALQGDYSALLISKDCCQPCDIEIWNTQCPIPIPYPPAPSGGPALTNPFAFPFQFLGGSGLGGFIGQDFEARAGNQLSWTWNLLGESPWDPVLAWMTDGITEIGVFPDPQGGTATVFQGPLGGAFFEYTQSTLPWSDEFAVSIPAEGTWTVYFGVSQRGDEIAWAGLLLDDVRLLVPEPSSIALAGICLALLAVLNRRVRRHSRT